MLSRAVRNRTQRLIARLTDSRLRAPRKENGV
jgi:hypothetical protein